MMNSLFLNNVHFLIRMRLLNKANKKNDDYFFFQITTANYKDKKLYEFVMATLK